MSTTRLAKAPVGKRAAPSMPAAQASLAALAAPRAMLRSVSSCACGGGCPRCAAPARSSAAVSIQRKPSLGAAGDAHEREADDLADRVMRMAEPAPVGAAAPTVRRKCATCEDDEPALDTVAAAQAASRGGAPLSSELRAWFEPRFGQDFSRVQVHADGAAANAARAMQARAYTFGRDIVFGAGEYAPATAQGRRLIAHELTHVVQQGAAGAAPGDAGVLQRKPLEAEQRAEDLQSAELRSDTRLQEAFDNAPEMKRKETSEGVKTLQRALRDLDYPLPVSFEKTGDADGIFGQETQDQVKQFQRDNGLTDNGVVERDTLRALDEKFNPTVQIESVYFGQDHRELIDNDVDWSASGAKYVDWADVPYHVVFEPGSLFGARSIPMSITAGTSVTAMAKVRIKGGIPGKTYGIQATPDGGQPGWTLSGEGTHQQGMDTDYVFLSAAAPLADKIAFQDFLMTWQTTTAAGATSTALSLQKVFLTSGKAHDPGATGPGGDQPNLPTFKRLKQAMVFARGLPATKADSIVYNVFRRFPNYGVCDVPAVPNTFKIACPPIQLVWEMSDHVRTGNFQCITISRYVNAVLNVLGVPGAVANIVAKPVVIWADPAHKEEGIDSDYPHPGINIPSIRHPRHPDWALGLLDGNCGINNYEACIKLQWTPPGHSDTVVQYYCGGLGEENPKEGFKTPREVLDSAFVLSYFVRMRKDDPSTGFPRGIRKKDVKVYNESGSCHDEL